MKELAVGDQVWVLCEVIDTGKDSVKVAGGNGTKWWMYAEQCRPVEQSLTTETDPPITKKDVNVVDRYCELVRSQGDFAWKIFADLSMMAQDAGASSKEANERAADLMRSWFSVNIRESEQWQQGTVCSIKTKKAMWAANDAANERPLFVEPPPGLRWSPGDRVRVADDGLPFMRRSGSIVVALPTYCEVVLDGNGHTHQIWSDRLEPESNEEDPSLVMEAEIKVEGKDTPPTTTSKDYYGPDISKVAFQFTQTPNALGTTSYGDGEPEELTVECEYQLPGEEPFFVIRSDSGWSFDDPELFYHLLLSVKEAEEKCRCSLLPS
jgi:hypothetical protein